MSSPTPQFGRSQRVGGVVAIVDEPAEGFTQAARRAQPDELSSLPNATTSTPPTPDAWSSRREYAP
jgi:hypothetical protein